LPLNSNIEIILLASAIAPIHLWLWTKHRKYFIFPLFLLLAFAIYFQARSGIIYAIAITFYPILKKYKINKKYIFISLFPLIIILLSIKKNSSLGRLYILKNTFQIIVVRLKSGLKML
jgi:hypothetical protein